MPRLNARAMAEMIGLPRLGYRQIALLRGQKFPREGAGKFMVPYYGPVITGIRKSLQAANRAAAIEEAEARAQSIGNKARRMHVLRALASYKDSDQMGRRLTVATDTRKVANIGTVELKASPDLFATDAEGEPVVLYYNWGAAAMDSELSRRILEISNWIYEESGSPISLRRFELFDLASGELHQAKVRRSKTIDQVNDMARAIEGVWDTLEPPANK